MKELGKILKTFSATKEASGLPRPIVSELNLIENYFTLVFDLIVSTIKMYNEEIEVNFKNVDSEYKKISPS